MTGTFNGFEPANTTPVPDILFDQLLSELSGSELKVLLYIIRRTSGFKKETDAISLSQFTDGIITREGKVLDHGCGIKNRTLVSKALAKLEKLGCIQSRKADDPTGDKATTVYSIRFRGSAKSVLPAEEGSNKNVPPSIQSVPPVVSKSHHRSNESVPGVVRKLHPQETVLQDTDKQETVIQEDSFASPIVDAEPSDASLDVDEEHTPSASPTAAPDSPLASLCKPEPAALGNENNSHLSTPDVDNSQVVGDTSVQQQMLVAPGASKQSARRQKKAVEPEPTPEELALKERCSRWYDRLTEWCGGPMTKGGQVINEHRVIKLACQKYSDSQLEAIFTYLTTRDWKYSKIDNKYTVRGYVLWDEAGRVAQILKEERCLKVVPTGKVQPMPQIKLPPPMPSREELLREVY